MPRRKKEKTLLGMFCTREDSMGLLFNSQSAWLMVGLLASASAGCGGSDAGRGAGDEQGPRFNEATCETQLSDGTLLWCFEGENSRDGFEIYLAEIPDRDDFGEFFYRQAFVLKYPDGITDCADAFGFTPGLEVRVGLAGFQCSPSRAQDRRLTGYKTYDMAMCSRPDRSQASWVIEPFDDQWRQVAGPFKRVCDKPCSPQPDLFCRGAI